MATVLAIDTSTVVAVGLARDGEPLGAVTVEDTRAHVERLTPTVVELITGAGVPVNGIDSVVVGMGPGPFTGLRVGIVTGWTLAAAIGCDWHGICGLDVIAAGWAQAPDEFVVCSDARRKEVYWARYVDGRRIGDPQVGSPAELPTLPTVGPGVLAYHDQLGDRVVDGPRTLDPQQLAVLGPQLPSVGADPLYLRRPDAAEPTHRKSALPTGPRRLRGLSPRGRS